MTLDLRSEAFKTRPETRIDKAGECRFSGGGVMALAVLYGNQNSFWETPAGR